MVPGFEEPILIGHRGVLDESKSGPYWSIYGKWMMTCNRRYRNFFLCMFLSMILCASSVLDLSLGRGVGQDLHEAVSASGGGHFDVTLVAGRDRATLIQTHRDRHRHDFRRDVSAVEPFRGLKLSTRADEGHVKGFSQIGRWCIACGKVERPHRDTTAPL